MRNSIARVLLSLLLLSGIGAAVGACHTIEGAGQDVESVGAAMDRAVH
jgi:predicted small secreted protein